MVLYKKTSMINIVIPMAGNGIRFLTHGITKPKQYADINGKPMFLRVMENLNLPDARFILIARSEHIQSEINLVQEIEQRYNAKFITIDKKTEGTACTALFAREEINNDVPLLIGMSDQIIDFHLNDFINDCSNKNLDGHILCFTDKSRSLTRSFAKTDESGLVTLVKEKEAISDLATAGVYFFAKGKDFVNGAIDMIINNDRVNNEFYSAPVYNYLISSNKRIGTFSIESKQMHHLTTQADFEFYIQQSARKKSVNMLNETT